MHKTPGHRRIRIESNARGQWRWFFVSGNGKIICCSEPRGSHEKVVNSANVFRKMLIEKPHWEK